MAIVSRPPSAMENAVIEPVETAPTRDLRTRLEHLVRVDAALWPSLVYAFAAAGCALRFLRWLDNPGLWLDESFLSLNLMEKSLHQMFGALQYLQSGPPGFLFVEKLTVDLVGDSERALRLFPLFVSIASVILFAFIARRTLAPPAAALAVAFFATAEPLLERSAEVKHYSFDVAVATLLVTLYLWAVAPSERRVWRFVLLGVVGPITLAFSFVAIFTLAAVVVALAIRAWEARSREVLTGAVVTAALSLASFGIVYAVASSNLNRVGKTIISGETLDFSVGRLRTFNNAWWTFKTPGGFVNETNSIAALLAGLGVIALARKGTLDRLALFALPFGFAFMADLFGRYPLGGRFSTFVVPTMYILVAQGAQALVSWSRHRLLVGAFVAVFLLGPPVAVAGYHVAVPPARSDIKPLLRHLVREWRPGDTLYVYPSTQYQLRYYSTCKDCRVSRQGFPWPTRLAPPGPPGDEFAPALESVPPTVIIGSRSSPGALLSGLDHLPSKGRIWLLFSHVFDENGLNEERLLMTVLERNADVLEQVNGRDTQLYLVRRRSP